MKHKIMCILQTLFITSFLSAQDYESLFNGDFKEATLLMNQGQNTASFMKMKSVAEKGFPLAQYELARDYDSGMGCSVNFTEAYNWMYKAAYSKVWDKVPLAVQGYQGAAYFYLGIYKMNGIGTSKNMVDAVTYWQKGSNFTSPFQANCYLQLGFGYQRGWGNLSQNLSKAKEMFKKSSDLGDPDAPYHLATFYAQGIGGVTQNDDEAFRYIKLSAERGYAKGQSLLGEIYENGFCGQQKSLPKAIEWYKKAAKQGESDAIGYLTELGVSW